MREVRIVGVSQAPITRDTSVRGRYLAASVVQAALDNAGVAKERVGALYVGNMTSGILAGQQQLGGLIADYAKLGGIDAVTIEAACASGAAALRMAYLTIAGGMHDVVVVCGLERMTHVDRDTVTRALATASDWELEGARGESFMSLNARLMRRYMNRYGAQPEDFAPFSINAHKNALTNPNALFHKDVDLEGYLRSRIVIDPIRVFDASPVCNGAAALVLAPAEDSQDLGLPGTPPVTIAGSAAATAPLALQRRENMLHLDAVDVSTRKALAQAGAVHKDISLFELHDAYTIMAVLSLESAGFAEPGTGTRFGTEGRIGLEGDLPLSTLGGLKARGHPVGATGVYQIVEAYLQLTGTAGANQVPNARTALVQNIGGTGATVVTHVLRRGD
ncbi:MAG TPA: beta-ketoacyl synthase N-terminal-like domain-containing protein [Gammaproteobacteria bacterium]|nr:beta-ketoacyl synthase N-terminal-like domain-containing protein [Gammaproteobacteria bacterium]